MPRLTIILKKIKQTKWWVEEGPGSCFLFDYIMKTFTQAEKIIRYPTLREMITVTKDNISLEITPYDEKRDNFFYIYKHELKQTGYFKNLLKPWAPLRRELLKLNQIIINGLHHYSTHQLTSLLKKFTQTSFSAVIYGAFIECVDPFSEEELPKFQARYRLQNQTAQNYFASLATPTRRSFLTQEKIDFLKLCLGEITAGQYCRNYYWINTNYRESMDFSRQLLRQKIKRELSNTGRSKIKTAIKKTIQAENNLISQKRKIITKLRLTSADKTLFKLLALFGQSIDIRKESMLRQTYSRDKLAQEISRRLSLDINIVRAMRDEEAIKILKGGKIDLEKIRSRNKIYAVYYTPRGETEFYGQAALAIYNTWLKTIKSAQVKGIVASAPVKKLTGKVSVVMDVNRENFQSGTILVTSMTRPEFMPLMRRAKAVITDEGGITCHAAIVSRELGIPCIIGTKNATQMLKNGDKIELDLQSGIIKIIR